MRNSFARNASIVTLGTALGQALPMLAAPLLTRLYEPASFGIASVFGSFVMVLAAVMTGKYELAINLPRRDAMAFDVFALSIVVSGAGAVALLLTGLLIPSLPQILFDASPLAPPVALLAFAAAFVAGLQTLSYWANRKNHFWIIALSRLIRGAWVAVASLTFGCLKTPQGLIYGSMLGTAFSCLITAISLRGSYPGPVRIRISRLRRVAYRYRELPLLNATTSALDSLTLMLPLLFIARAYDVSVVGQFGLAVTVLGVPVSVLAGSTGQVAFGRVAEMQKSGENLLAFIFKTTRHLVAMGILPTLLLLFFGAAVFEVLFGRNWRLAGLFAQLLGLSYFVRLAVSPFSMALAAINEQKALAAWKIAYFAGTLITLALGVHLTVLSCVAMYVAHEIAAYLAFYGLIVWRCRRVSVVSGAHGESSA